MRSPILPVIVVTANHKHLNINGWQCFCKLDREARFTNSGRTTNADHRNTTTESIRPFWVFLKRCQAIYSTSGLPLVYPPKRQIDCSTQLVALSHQPGEAKTADHLMTFNARTADWLQAWSLNAQSLEKADHRCKTDAINIPLTGIKLKNNILKKVFDTDLCLPSLPSLFFVMDVSKEAKRIN